MEKKSCSHCHQILSLDLFSKRADSKDKYHSVCKQCDNKRLRDYYKNNLNRRLDINRRNKIQWDQLKHAAILHYGGYHCACCREETPAFLSIDHVEGGGHQHRKSIGNGHFYRWLKKNNYPPGFQILCMNCNFGKRMNGGICPHSEVKS
jgi:hypothetical protein